MSPRVLSRFSGVPVLLEDEVRECLARRSDTRICVHGPRGAGKTVALNHLAAVLADCQGVQYVDDAEPEQWSDPAGFSEQPVVFSSRRPTHVPVHAGDAFRVCHLAPWSEDDLIEYLLAVHRSQCGSVIRRLHESNDIELLQGVPELCRVVLDYMAEHDRVASVRESVDAILRGRVRSEQLLRRIQEHCRELLVEPDQAWPNLRRWLQGSHIGEREIKLLRHFPVQVMLSAGILIRDLAHPERITWSPGDVPRALIEETGVRVSHDRVARHRLEEAFPVAPAATMPMLASILHRAVRDWRPPPVERLFLQAARLPGAMWRDLDLGNADLRGACLDNADLRQVDLVEANLQDASLRKASLARSSLHLAVLRRADLTGADLTRVRARATDFEFATVVGVEGEGADLRDSSWGAADLSDSNFVAADFTGADFDQAMVLRTDFSNAVFDHANLMDIALCDALVLGASFRHALLQHANLESMILPEVDFTGANLNRARMTGSVIPEGNFHGAFLRRAELADISWEHADLTDADLRGARFHAGTTRSGARVGTAWPAWEHPTTYPDDVSARDYLPPEAMRKANLCGADLRGAIIDDVDFYLVDLRYARYDDDQAEVLRRSGAILQSHT